MIDHLKSGRQLWRCQICRFCFFIRDRFGKVTRFVAIAVAR